MLKGLVLAGGPANLKAMGFDGLRVVAFESRRAKEMAELIRKQEGDPFVAPSMRELPIENNPAAFEFAEKLFQGGFDMVIFLTGVGTRALHRVIETRYPPGRLAEILRSINVVARGPKPAAALREIGVPVSILAPEPNTWREVLALTAGRPERRIAIQEYGRPNHELIDGLKARGAEVTAVPVYVWGLPDDTAPLREAARRIASGQAEVALFTTSIQVDHLMKIAAEEAIEDAVRAALPSMVVASIGPTTSEALEEYGIIPDLVPSRPKMGFLVKETSEQARSIISRKRARHAEG